VRCGGLRWGKGKGNGARAKDRKKDAKLRKEYGGRPGDRLLRMGMMELEGVTLRGKRVELVPLALEQAEGLAEAAKDGELWRLWYTSVPRPEEMEHEIARRLGLWASGSMLPWAVKEPVTGELVGMTTYMNVDRVNRRVEIGSTWYAARVQRTGLNTEAKLLLLEHAFERLGCIAVEFRTHFFNTQSREAIERLGAKLDGTLRSHSVAGNGTLRDTCVYSLVAGEWPAARANLEWRLEKARAKAMREEH
jgi:RimJ/RimL family protein N-acetyltransferase